MASCYAAMKRSKGDWDALLEEAGLQIEKIWKYTEQLDDCVIVAVPNGLVALPFPSNIQYARNSTSGQNL
jgi:hypothetical protein